MIVLAGDIGGTHARLARFRAEGGDLELIDEATVGSRGYPGPAPIVREFLSARGLTAATDLDGVCVAIAGPIRDGVCRVSNLGWTIEIERFGTDVEFPGATIINDFEAIGNAVPSLRPEDCAELQQGQASGHAPIAIVGPGTGLGHAFLTWQGTTYRVWPSEGGHTDFAPRTPPEWAFAEHLRQRYGHASWERVISGPGLVELYRFLAGGGEAFEAWSLGDEHPTGDAARVISRNGMEGTDPLCVKTLDMFVSALAAQAGNLALTLEAYGGVYIAGGIAPQILKKLKEDSFLDAFRGKGRMSTLLERIPVRVILDDRVGLEGAARVASLSR